MNVTSARSDKLTSELSDIYKQGMEIANYELMVVASVGDEAEGFFKKLESFLTDAKVSNLKTERLGKKPLAYQIAKQVEGEYAIYTFSASSDVPQSLLTMIKLEQDLVLRYLITRVKESKGSKGSKVTKGTKVEESEDKPEVEEKKVSLPGSGQAKVKVEAKVKEVKGTKVSLRDSVQAKGIKAKKK